MDLTAIQTPFAGLLAGLVTSVHCIGMCGPLACAAIPGKNPVAGSPQWALASYHGSRLLSYALVGALAGVLGGAIAHLFAFPLTAFLPWALVVLFLAFLLGWEKRARLPAAVSKLAFRLRLRTARWGEKRTGAVLGALTPFLPCAPLYMVFGVAVFSGSALAGGILLAAFALGTVAPLWLVQSQYFRLRSRFSPVTLARIQKSLALISLLLIAWRAGAGDGFDPATGGGASCPFH